MALVRILALAIASVGLAGLAAADAWSRVNESRLPQASEGLPLANGFAQAEQAEDLLRLATQPGPTALSQPVIELDSALERRIASLSLEGYRREPLNVAAVRNLGLVAETNDDAERARELFEVARQITRRDLWTNGWLADHYARADSITLALRSYDEALRASLRAQETMLPVLLQYLQSPLLVEPVIDLLKSDPPWRNQFWGAAPSYAAALPNIARVREAMFDTGQEMRIENDRNLITELASHGHFAAAERLIARLGDDRREGEEVFRNADFLSPPGFLPFGWETFFDSNLTTEIDAASGLLNIATYSDGGGRAARQIVALPRSVYTFTAKAEGWDRLDEQSLYFRLDCAERGRRPQSRQVAIDRPNFSVTFRKPQADCTYYWFSLYVLPTESRENNVVTLDDVSLRPAADAG